MFAESKRPAPAMGPVRHLYLIKLLVLGILLAFVFLRGGIALAEEPSSVDAEDGEKIALNLGEQRVVPAAGVRSYSEGTRGIVDVRLTRDAKQFVLVAVAPGTTSLLFLMNDGSERHFSVEVRDPNQPSLSETAGLLSVERLENIRLDFYFVELDRTYSHSLGPRYATAIQGPTFAAAYDLLARSFSSATAVVQDQALLSLDIAQSAGWVKVMRQAAIITQNGQPARFSGGGEFNVVVTSALTTGVQSISFGSTIEVLPRFDRDTARIAVELSADVADLTDDRGTGVPGRTRSTLRTIVNLELGQVIVLGGLSASSEQVTKSGLPFLSQIPVLGALFRTHRAEKSHAESMVFIVPSVVDTPPAEVRRQLRSALATYDKFRGERETTQQLHELWERKESVTP